ncbi:helix-turn-helix domain-containing protein [Streptosporangiaceae bacterium NEAU-GS5]|nr:helix-turn-helix domain-containing protein [Streptosporangiaceae bacterium NEAU-GS5]
MDHRISPPLRGQRLGRWLRELREGAGLTLEQVGSRIGCSPATVSRIEIGKVRVSEDGLIAALDLFGADAGLRETCLRLARQAAARPWWWPYRTVLGPYIALETEAEEIRSWQPLLVEGLVQTEAYARAVFEAGTAEPSKVELQVRARMARQERLLAGPDPIVVSVTLHENALHTPVGGPAVMRAQLAHLAEVAELPHVTLRILPRSVGAHPGMGGAFVLITIPADPPYVFVEGAPGEAITSEQIFVRDYERRWTQLTAAAMRPEDSLKVLESIAREI